MRGNAYSTLEMLALINNLGKVARGTKSIFSPEEMVQGWAEVQE